MQDKNLNIYKDLISKLKNHLYYNLLLLMMMNESVFYEGK